MKLFLKNSDRQIYIINCCIIYVYLSELIVMNLMFNREVILNVVLKVRY